MKLLSNDYYGTCPGCNKNKFIGHGPLCNECYINPAVMNNQERNDLADIIDSIIRDVEEDIRDCPYWWDEKNRYRMLDVDVESMVTSITAIIRSYSL